MSLCLSVKICSRIPGSVDNGLPLTVDAWLFQGARPGGHVVYHCSCKFMSRLNNGESSCHSWPVALLNEDLGGGVQVSELASDLGFSFIADSLESLQITGIPFQSHTATSC